MSMVVYTCSNCKGKKVFADLRCSCTWFNEEKTAKPDCEKCLGTGVYDNPCPMCNGEGCFVVEETFGYRFVYEGDAGRKVYDIDFRKPFPIKKETSFWGAQGLIGKENANDVPLTSIQRCHVDSKQLVDQVAHAFGMTPDRMMHVQTQDGYQSIDPAAFQLNFTAVPAVKDVDARGYAQVPVVPLPEADIQQSLFSEIVHCISLKASERTVEDQLLVIELLQLPSTTDLLTELKFEVGAYGAGFRLSMHEGNIGTGQTGTAVYFVYKEHALAELSVYYTTDIAVFGALQALKVPDMQEKLRQAIEEIEQTG